MFPGVTLSNSSVAAQAAAQQQRWQEQQQQQQQQPPLVQVKPNICPPTSATTSRSSTPAPQKQSDDENYNDDNRRPEASSSVMASSSYLADHIAAKSTTRHEEPQRPQFGFLEPMRTAPLPAGAAWDPIRPLAEMLLGPCDDEREFRRDLEALNEERGEAVACALERAVDELPEAEVGAAYSALTLLAQKYLYGVQDNDASSSSPLPQVIPRCIARPWKRLSERRGSPLTMSYDALVISNWRLRDPSLPPTIDNIDGYLTVRGTEPERGFIRVHAAIEAAAGDLPRRMLTISTEVKTMSDPAARCAKLNAFLREIAPRVESIRYLIGCMYRNVKREDYWASVRSTLLGTPEHAFPNGVELESTGVVMERKGGSGAQSPVMHALDRFFAVDHVDPGIPPEELTDRQALVLRTLDAPPEHARKFIDEQVTLMCAAHRRLHEQLRTVPNARQLVLRYGDDESAALYNACVGELEKVRKVHKQVAHQYIARQQSERQQQQQQQPAIDGSVSPASANSASSGGGVSIAGESKGTAGTNFEPLMAQLIKETAMSRLPVVQTTSAPVNNHSLAVGSSASTSSNSSITTAAITPAAASSGSVGQPTPQQRVRQLVLPLPPTSAAERGTAPPPQQLCVVM